MISTTKETFLTTINSPVRHIPARVELLKDNSTQCDIYTSRDRLVSFTIERVGEGKFFGYGICHRLNVHLRDVNRELEVNTSNMIEVVFGAQNDYLYAFPPFRVREVHRSEITNELSITGYDALYDAANHTISELDLSSYSLEGIAQKIARAIGLNLRLEVPENDTAFAVYYPNGANLDGTEPFRTVLDEIAEATQTIYYVNNQWELVFKRLDKDGSELLTIDKSKYYTLNSKTNKRLKTIISATELGDNVSASTTANGSTQYLRDNPFLELRDDIGDILNLAIARVGDITINQFECDWRGNYLMEIGDKIALITKDNEKMYSYLLDDTITYNGTYTQKSKWSYADDTSETPTNPATLGEALKQTYARVDKTNKQIELLVSDNTMNKDNIASLIMTTGEIDATVQKVEKSTGSALGKIEDDIAVLTNRVNASITAENVKIEVEKQLENGIDKVITSTGYIFDEEGLTVSKSSSEMTTKITEDGMRVYKDNEEVLSASNTGVDAVNLHATTYLIIGKNSRIEDYGDNRTGCFWVKGV